MLCGQGLGEVAATRGGRGLDRKLRRFRVREAEHQIQAGRLVEAAWAHQAPCSRPAGPVGFSIAPAVRSRGARQGASETVVRVLVPSAGRSRTAINRRCYRPLPNWSGCCDYAARVGQ